jgi:hypothetical protein
VIVAGSAGIRRQRSRQRRVDAAEHPRGLDVPTSEGVFYREHNLSVDAEVNALPLGARRTLFLLRRKTRLRKVSHLDE